MTRFLTILLALMTLQSAANAAPELPPATMPAAPRRVFAHYMVCYATYGEKPESYQREIREAQAAGIDGFALNVGSWKEAYYPRRVRMIYEAARALGTGFQLFFSVDLGHVPDILDMIRTCARHPNQFTHDGRVVVSTFSHDQVRWQEQVLTPLKQEGIGIFFVPYFYPRPKVTELPDYPAVVQHLKQHAGLVDGLFYFGAAGTSQQLADVNSAYARALREGGKLFMASYTPSYWGHRQPGRRYFETEGGQGTALQWQAIIAAQPEWVEIVTWNDFNESSYVCPVDDPGQYFGELKALRRHCHAGYLELSRHFIAWYKSGRQPAIEKDSLYWFYRTHPKDAVAEGEDKPVTALKGRVEDVLYVTTLLTAPAELRVRSGESLIRRPVQAGMQHLAIPFSAGPQRFEIWRGERCIAAGDGQSIEARIQKHNFFTTSGFAVSKPGAPPK